jgi:hypothetical protein
LPVRDEVSHALLSVSLEKDAWSLDEPDFFLGHRRSSFHETSPTNTVEAAVFGRGWQAPVPLT